MQRIDIFVFFPDNTSRCSLIHFHEFFYKDLHSRLSRYNVMTIAAFSTVCRVSPLIVKSISDRQNHAINDK